MMMADDRLSEEEGFGDREEDEMVSLVSQLRQTTEDHSSLTRSTTKTKAPKAALSRPFCLSSLVMVLGLCLLLFAMQTTDGVEEPVDWLTKPAHNSSGQNNEQEPVKVKVPRKGSGEIDEPGYKMTPNRLSPKYLPRTNLSLQEKKALADKWGEWTFVDPKAGARPTDFYDKYPNRDVPRDAFPPNAWQLDREYLSNFLNESIQLVERSMEAILGEYGQSKFDRPGVDFEERSKMFYVNLVDIDDNQYLKNFTYDPRNSAGYMFENGWKGLQRRILHAIMTEDSFTFVMGGHSSAAGHGNHFWQSYTLQFGKVIEPVFARMGVFFKAHNIGMGGLGTLHNALGAKDIYGENIDILYWDSEMTERSDHENTYFLKAGIVSGKRAPVLWGMKRNLPQTIAKSTGGDVGWMSGEGLAGIRRMESIEDGNKLPWASRYMNCGSEVSGECNANKYNTMCWIPRDDFEPPTHQYAVVGGQAKWHPGWRWHQLQGRIHAFALLRAMHAALTRWIEAEDYILSDDAWHVTEHYESIRSTTLQETHALCSAMQINPLFCMRPIHGRTEFTPRPGGYQASIRSILKNDVMPSTQPNAYDPPDVPYDHVQPPANEVDALAVIENGIDFSDNVARKAHVDWLKDPTPIVSRSKDYMMPGKGLALIQSAAAADNCDGTWDSWCNRGKDQNCMLIHHNDARGGIKFDGLSGWLVLNLANVEEGFIAIKMETWHSIDGSFPATEGWECENNDCGVSRAPSSDSSLSVPTNTTIEDPGQVRRLKAKVPDPCPAYQFHFAVDGNVTTWDADTFNAHRKQLERVVEIFELVHDKSLVENGPRDVELAIKITGCKRLIAYSLTHVYWA